MIADNTVYAAFYTTPDYTSSGGSLKSIHKTLEGAIASLYPESAAHRADFRKSVHTTRNIWTGPDGFGEVREMEVQP